MSAESDPNKFYTWTVELSVSAPWVADGFDISDDDAVAALLLQGQLSHCRSDEVRGRVIKAPPAAEIAYEQGAKVADIEAMKILVGMSGRMRDRLIRFAASANGADDVFARDVRLDASLEKRRLLMLDRTPTEMGWRVLAYLGVSRRAAA